MYKWCFQIFKYRNTISVNVCVGRGVRAVQWVSRVDGELATQCDATCRTERQVNVSDHDATHSSGFITC